MKSAEVYKTLRESLGPWCKVHGFQRTRSAMLGWYKPVREGCLVFWFQCSQDGWDRYAGSKFVVEFQVADSPVPGLGMHRARLARLLDEAQREDLRQHNNCVIMKLRKPDPSYFIFAADQKVIEWYLSNFDPVEEKYRANEDVWLRYGEEEDVRMWARWILGVLPSVLHRFLPDERPEQ
jgi:hypothetical protein